MKPAASRSGSPGYYAFDLYLPPKPHAEARPVWTMAKVMGPLPVEPQITPFPKQEPRGLRVVIPLQGLQPAPDQYGVVIAGGWTDPDGTEAKQIMRVRVTVQEIFLDRELDSSRWGWLGFGDKGQWQMYIGINGRWHVYKNLTHDSETLTESSVILDLHPSDRIVITASGRETDAVDTLMGRNIGLSWSDVEDPGQATKAAGKIRDGFFSLGTDLGPDIENENISEFSVVHNPQERGPFLKQSSQKDYRLRYSIEGV